EELSGTPEEYLTLKMKEKARIYGEVRDATVEDTKRVRERQDRTRAGREYELGELVKMQAGEYSPSDRPKLSDYWIGPYTVTKVLGRGAYELALPDGTRFHSKVNADRLDYWHPSDLSDYPKIGVAKDASGRYQVRRYLLRDFSGFPRSRRSPRYWVEGTSEDAANRYFYVDEDAEILEDILAQEERQGCLPEKGIGQANRRAVGEHKLRAYGLDPSPIVTNTWNGPLPYTTRTEPSYRLPGRMENAVHGVVHDTWRMTDGTDQWYQALVLGQSGDGMRIRWTDGREEVRDWKWIKDHWYNPVSLVFRFR
ncbi:MAG: hypothetical protein ACO33E_06695, partial [Aquiluna sp.]